MKIRVKKIRVIALLMIMLVVLPLSMIAQNTKVFLIIGQSNAAGKGELSTPLVELDNVMVLNDSGVFEKATPALNNYSTIRNTSIDQGYNLGYTFGQAMYDNTGDQIRLVVNARGGSSIDAWEIGASQNYYAEAVARTHLALQEAGTGSQLAGIIWHQGESNYARSTYIAELTPIIEGLRTEFGNSNLPFIAGELSYEEKNYLNFNYDLISQLTISVTNTAVVSAEGLTTVPADNIHFDALSQQILGARYAIKMLHAMGVNDSDIDVTIPEPNPNGITHFSPDPNKEYYIQSQAGKRLAANGSDTFATAVEPTTVNATTIWKFIYSGDDGLYHIQLASESDRPRLQSNNNGIATMLTASSSGGWTKFLMEERTHGERVYHITAPFGSDGERRLYLDSTNGIAGMHALTNEGDESTFSIVEVNSLSIVDLELERISCFPNPTNSSFSINKNINKIEIYNLTGKTIKSFRGDFRKGHAFNISDLPQSIYLVKVANNLGEENTIKLVKL